MFLSERGTAELDEHGNVTGTAGTWRTGTHGAEPGIFMDAAPSVGDGHRQEYDKGHAEDRYKIIELSSSVSVPAGQRVGERSEVGTFDVQGQSTRERRRFEVRRQRNGRKAIEKLGHRYARLRPLADPRGVDRDVRLEARNRSRCGDVRAGRGTEVQTDDEGDHHRSDSQKHVHRGIRSSSHRRRKFHISMRHLPPERRDR